MCTIMEFLGDDMATLNIPIFLTFIHHFWMATILNYIGHIKHGVCEGSALREFLKLYPSIKLCNMINLISHS